MGDLRNHIAVYGGRHASSVLKFVQGSRAREGQREGKPAWRSIDPQMLGVGDDLSSNEHSPGYGLYLYLGILQVLWGFIYKICVLVLLH